MDIKEITITENDINDIFQEAHPGEPASYKGDACAVFKQARPLIMTGIAILAFVYSPAGSAITAIVAILDKACESE